MAFHIDRFSSFDHLTKKQLQDPEVVLAVAKTSGKVSTFECSENPSIWHALKDLERGGKIKFRQGGYPWTFIDVIEAAP